MCVTVLSKTASTFLITLMARNVSLFVVFFSLRQLHVRLNRISVKTEWRVFLCGLFRCGSSIKLTIIRMQNDQFKYLKWQCDCMSALWRQWKEHMKLWENRKWTAETSFSSFSASEVIRHYYYYKMSTKDCRPRLYLLYFWWRGSVVRSVSCLRWKHASPNTINSTLAIFWISWVAATSFHVRVKPSSHLTNTVLWKTINEQCDVIMYSCVLILLIELYTAVCLAKVVFPLISWMYCVLIQF